MAGNHDIIADERLADEFYLYAQSIIDSFRVRSLRALDSAARLIVEKLHSGGRFLVAGTGHSHMLAEEFYTRAGGIACVTPVLPSEFQFLEHPQKSTEIERLEQYASVVMKLYSICDADAILIASNSGRNSMTVELARLSKSCGATVIAFTGVSRTIDEHSRHSSGLYLKDYADIVIDSCVPSGDAAFEVPGVNTHMGAMSTIVGAYMVQLMSILIARGFIERDEAPPVFKSSNIDGGDEWNDTLFRRYLEKWIS